MRLLYVTRTSLPSRAAQSIQVNSMSKAFNQVIGKRYCLISGEGDRCVQGLYEYCWEPRPVPRQTLLRYLKFCGIAVRRSFLQREIVIFTRDIGIAFAVVCVGGRAVYEAHKEPAGVIAAAMTQALGMCERFRMVAISRALGEYYIKKYRISRNQILVAHDGVFPEEYRPLDSRTKEKVRIDLGLPRRKLVVVHTGSLYKGGAEVFGEVAKAGGDEVEVVQVGGTEEEHAFWSRYYAARGVHNIKFVTHQPREKVRLYQLSADLLLYVNSWKSPICWCTSPLKLFEYMATGVPILAAAIGAVREVINEGNAFCYDPDRPSSLIAAWERFRGYPEDAEERAARAREEVVQKYSWYGRAERIITFAFGRTTGCT